MDNTVSLIFEFTDKELRTAILQRKRDSAVAIIWPISILVTIAALLVFSVIVVTSIKTGKWGNFGIIEFTFIGLWVILAVMNVQQHPFVSYLIAKKKCAPLFGEIHKWDFSENGFNAALGKDLKSSGSWESFKRIVSTNLGVLVYFRYSTAFIWLPVHAFKNKTDIKVLIDLAKNGGLSVEYENEQTPN